MLRRVADHLSRWRLRRWARQVARTSTKRHWRSALLAGYPDRVARRRATEVVSGSSWPPGAAPAMGRESARARRRMAGCARRHRGRAGALAEALVRMAAAVEPEWLSPTSRAMEHRFDAAPAARCARSMCERYDEIVLREQPGHFDRGSRAAAARPCLAGTRAGRGDAAARCAARASPAWTLDLPRWSPRRRPRPRARSPTSTSPRRCRGRRSSG